MQNIYRIHKTSNSYWNSESYDTTYYLCETEEEYNLKLAQLKAEYQSIVDEYKKYEAQGCYENFFVTGEPYMAYLRYERISLSEEQKVFANEYYENHEWQGKTFTAFGFSRTVHYERGYNTEYYLKPNSVSDIKECTDRGIGWMYGS